MVSPLGPLRAATAILVVGLISVGCGDSDSFPEARDAAARYLSSVADADPEVCSLVSEGERKRIVKRAQDAGRSISKCPAVIKVGGAPLNREQLLGDAERIDQAEIAETEAGLTIFPVEAPDQGRQVSAMYLILEDDRWVIDKTLGSS